MRCVRLNCTLFLLRMQLAAAFFVQGLRLLWCSNL